MSNVLTRNTNTEVKQENLRRYWMCLLLTIVFWCYGCLHKLLKWYTLSTYCSLYITYTTIKLLNKRSIKKHNVNGNFSSQKKSIKRMKDKKQKKNKTKKM